jgi:hypothetical protein
VLRSLPNAAAQRDDLIRRGEASASFDTFTDDMKNHPEEQAQSTVVYTFNLLPQAVAFGYAFALARSPVKSGTYRRGWIVAVGSSEYTEHIEDIWVWLLGHTQVDCAVPVSLSLTVSLPPCE